MAASGTTVFRVVGFTSLLLGPAVIVLDRLDAVDELTLFVLAAAALIPISWLIGEATDNVALYTGPGIGGFLNATFGNAPELIIAIVAIADGLTEIVRASLVGSIVGNLLLVLGFTLLLGQKGKIDRLSAYVSLGLVAFVGLVVLVAATPGLHGDPDRRSLAVLSLPLAVVLLIVRVVVTRRAFAVSGRSIPLRKSPTAGPVHRSRRTRHRNDRDRLRHRNARRGRSSHLRTAPICPSSSSRS